jgi:hypothetical protein
LDRLRDFLRLEIITYNPSVNNNSSIVPVDLNGATMDATEVYFINDI